LGLAGLSPVRAIGFTNVVGPEWRSQSFPDFVEGGWIAPDGVFLHDH
jgi:hypothetical protein